MRVATLSFLLLLSPLVHADSVSTWAANST